MAYRVEANRDREQGGKRVQRVDGGRSHGAENGSSRGVLDSRKALGQADRPSSPLAGRATRGDWRNTLFTIYHSSEEYYWVLSHCCSADSDFVYLAVL